MEFGLEIDSLPVERRLLFYEYLAHELTIVVRTILSEANISESEKLDRIRWVNEIQHRVVQISAALRQKSGKWSGVDFEDLVRHWISQNEDLGPQIKSAIERCLK